MYNIKASEQKTKAATGRTQAGSVETIACIKEQLAGKHCTCFKTVEFLPLVNCKKLISSNTQVTSGLKTMYSLELLSAIQCLWVNEHKMAMKALTEGTVAPYALNADRWVCTVSNSRFHATWLLRRTPPGFQQTTAISQKMNFYFTPGLIRYWLELSLKTSFSWHPVSHSCCPKVLCHRHSSFSSKC